MELYNSNDSVYNKSINLVGGQYGISISIGKDQTARSE